MELIPVDPRADAGMERDRDANDSGCEDNSPSEEAMVLHRYLSRHMRCRLATTPSPGCHGPVRSRDGPVADSRVQRRGGCFRC